MRAPPSHLCCLYRFINVLLAERFRLDLNEDFAYLSVVLILVFNNPVVSRTNDSVYIQTDLTKNGNKL